MEWIVLSVSKYPDLYATQLADIVGTNYFSIKKTVITAIER